MAEPKTTKSHASVAEFLAGVADPKRRADAEAVTALIAEVTGAEPTMWGTSIVGFGRYMWYGASGKGVEWMVTAFAPRKANLTIYLWPEFDGKQELLGQLGKHSCGKGCLYIKRLSDVHLPTLTKLIAASVRHARTRKTVLAARKTANARA